MAEEVKLTPQQIAEKEKIERAREIVKKHYRQPLAVVQFLLDDKPQHLMRRVIERAEAHFDARGIPAIVKQQTKDEKQELYSLDYYFFVKNLALFAHDVFIGKSKELAEAMQVVIEADFGGKAYYKNKAYLVNVFDSLGILFANVNKKWLYSLQRYRQVHSGDKFILACVTIDGNYIKSLDGIIKNQFVKIVNPLNYEFEERGQKVWSSKMSEGKPSPYETFM